MSRPTRLGPVAAAVVGSVVVACSASMDNAGAGRRASAAAAPAREVHYTFAGPTSVAFDWVGSRPIIRYGRTSRYGNAAVARAPRPLPFSSGGPFREVRLTRLKPDATYHYSIGGGSDRIFTTAPGTSYRFDVEADVGDSADADQVRTTQQQIAADKPAFVIVAGDLTYGNANGQGAVDRH